MEAADRGQNGLELRGPEGEPLYSRVFESREHGENPPQLVITYHLPPAEPYTFTGHVYQGYPPDASTPVGGVTVRLWGDDIEWPEDGRTSVCACSPLRLSKGAALVDEVKLMVSPEFLGPGDRVLIIDDFLASGQTIGALVELAQLAGATIVGIGAVIEKAFKHGREELAHLHVPIEALAVITSMEDGRSVLE